MRHVDWGALSPRWAGIRSEETDVHGTTVHYLRADGSGDGPTHLLIHPLAGSATMWLDAIGPLAGLGPVIAPDLPGTLFGHTAAPHPRAARAEPNARFLRAFTARLGLDGVIAHGWSMGALVALMFADLAPERVGRLVLVTPALPGPLPEREALWWRTWGRLILSAGAPPARAALRLTGRPLLDYKLRMYTDQSVRAGGRLVGGDLSRLSPAMSALLAAELRGARPERLGHAVTALASLMTAVFVDQSRVREMITRLAVPTLLLLGGQDKMMIDGAIDELATLRPDWDRHVFEDAGHMLPLELPGGYAEVVGRWAERKT
ncbi:alpha/beta fold hydrolase [Nonomuraea sp. LPB2021202275-12-8]|uniref:alpha/beta fold hydrolase n=1 Tax=Nonomuraea sp. LPB2021202275-12-8 TaxID=3120159 RepID=UPI00300DB52C